MDSWIDSSGNIDLWNNTKPYIINMLDNDILSWLGNFINFLILVYVASAVINTQCFDIVQLSVTTFGLIVSIIINMYTSLIRK